MRTIHHRHRIWCWFLLCCLILVPGLMTAETGNGQNTVTKNWLKIYYQSQGLKRINAAPISEIDSVYYTLNALEASSSISSNANEYSINVASRYNPLFSLEVDSIQSMVLGTNIPTIYIDTDPYVDEITSKTDYIDATFRYIPYDGKTDTLTNTVSIRGRGNSSWSFPKKPYRLKFDKKQSLAGLPKAKSFVLLSNYIDNTLMRNAVAMKIAQLLELPFTNRIVPVNLVFNGKQRGNYMLTNKVGINSGSVDIDEKEGVLWEIDNYFDEEFRFYSPTFHQPCMLKDPDLYELADGDEEKIAEMWEYWQADLETAFQKVKNGEWREAFEEEDFINYFIVQDLTLNREMIYPRSLYLYKESKDGKYRLGPVWDYDWAMGFSHDIEDYIISSGAPSFPFLGLIFSEEIFLETFKAKFDRFCDEKLPEIMAYIDEYASQISDSAIYDAMLWPEEYYEFNDRVIRNASQFEENIRLMKEWIMRRIELIKKHPKYLLYRP